MTSLFHNIVASLPIQTILAQAEYQSNPEGGGIAALFGVVIWLALMALIIAGTWKMFVKAGKPGWAAIIPIYNFVVVLEITGKPIWWIALLFIPFVNFVILILIMIALARSFGKGVGFGLGCAFLGFIFIPILGFGDAKYIGPQP